MSEFRYDKNLKPCPFCGHKGVNVLRHAVHSCGNDDCEEDFVRGIHTSTWQNRPIEDAANARIIALEKQLGMAEKVMDECKGGHDENCDATLLFEDSPCNCYLNDIAKYFKEKEEK